MSYSYMVGNVWFPVTGGLFLGNDAAAARLQTTGHFPDSQDQRNTLRTQFRYQATPRLWLAAGASFGSGLPFEFDDDPSKALAEYGSQVIDHLNFARGRILPAFLVNASAGAALLQEQRLHLDLQADGENLGDTLNVIDFGGLFSGNAIGPARSFTLRMLARF